MIRWLAIMLLLSGDAWAGASRAYVGANAEAMLSTSTGVTSYPATMMCWAYHTADSAVDRIFQIADDSAAFKYEMELLSRPTLELNSQCQSPASQGRAVVGSSVFTLDAWHFIAGRHIGATDRAGYVDDSSGTNATSCSVFTVMSDVGMGRLFGTSPGNYYDGNLAYCAYWSSDIGAALLQNDLRWGLWPEWVGGNTLEGLYPQYGVSTTTEPDLSSNGFDMTLEGTSTNIPDPDDLGPPVFFPIGGM